MAHESDDRSAQLEFIDLGRLGCLGNLHFGFNLVVPLGGILALAFEHKSVHITDFCTDIGFHRLVQICKYLKRHEVFDQLEGLQAKLFSKNPHGDRRLDIDDFFS